MNKLDKIYENMPDDFKERRKKRKPVYSSTDYVLGIRGKLIKLLVSFIYYFLTISATMVFLSLEVDISQMSYIIGVGFVLMIGIWLISLTRCNNLIRLVVALGILVPGFMFSPYRFIINIAVFSVYLLITLILIARLKKPEKLILTPTLVIASDIIIGIIQLPLIFNAFKNQNSLEVRNVLLIMGIIWIIISWFIANSININRITNNNSKTSKSIIYGNISLTILFSAIVLLIASFGAYKEMIINAFRSLLRWIFSGSVEQGDEVVENLPRGQQMDMQDLVGEAGEQSVLWKVLEIIVIILFIIIGIFLVYYLGKKLIFTIKKGIISLYQYLGDKGDVTPNDVKYSDEVESSFDKTEFSDSFKKGLNKLTSLFKKKPTLSNMKDNKAKVRFLYKRILKDSTKENNQHNNVTAREFFEQKGRTEDVDVFVEGYEKARYSSHEVNDDAVDKGMKMAGIKK